MENEDLEVLRERFGGLTEEEIEHIAEKAAQKTLSLVNPESIAERAAEKALDLVYLEVGKSVVRKVAWAAGVVFLGLLTWLSAKGMIK